MRNKNGRELLLPDLGRIKFNFRKSVTVYAKRAFENGIKSDPHRTTFENVARMQNARDFYGAPTVSDAKSRSAETSMLVLLTADLLFPGDDL